MGKTKTYDVTQVACTVGAALIKAESITCSFDEKEWMKFCGNQGEVVRSKNANRLGVIKIGILQTNDDNLLMDAAQKSAVLVPVQVKDFNGTSYHLIAEGTVDGQPNKTYNKEGKEVLEWEVFGYMTAVIGGNT